MSFGFGVGDFLAVLEIANEVRKKISDAPRDFKVLDAEVRALSITLHDVDVWLHPASEKQKENASIVLEECRILLHQLQELLGSFTALQESQGGGSRQRLQGKVKKLYTSVKWDSEDIKSFQLRIVSNITKLNNIGQKGIQADIDGLVAHKDYQQRSDLLKWISPHDYAEKHCDILCKRVDPSASQWVLESKQFSTWLQGPGKTLFCPGIPGAGKTMTTAIVVDNLLSNQTPYSLTAFLYCSYESQEQQSHGQLIASVLRSLVQQLPMLPDSIQHLYETQGKLGAQLTPQQIVSAVKTISTSVDRVNILIDALDELPSQARNDIVETMLRIQSDTGSSLFLTSRHNAGIEEKVQPDPALTIEIRAAPEDVQNYLRANLFRLPRCVSGKEKIQKSIVQSITEVVDGMFLLAELHLNSLQNKTSIKEIRTALSRLSSGSSDYAAAYNEAWHRINTQPEEHKDLATRTIAILVTARRPLTVVELCHALSVDIENEQTDDEEGLRDIEDILATCAGLVTTDTGSNTVRLFHKSTQDYFHRKRAELFSCAEYMMGMLCGIYRRTKGSDPLKPFYDYADKNWWSHLTHATKSQELAELDLNREEARPTQRLAQSKLSEQLSIQLGIEMFGSDPTLYQTMLRACEAGKQSLLESLLDITHFDVKKDSKLLSIAVKKCDEGILEALLSRGADPNSRDGKKGILLLYAAVQSKHKGILKILLSWGADVNANLSERNKDPVIFEAIRLRCPEIVQMILNFEGDVECRSRYHDYTPLLSAAAIGELSCLRLLLKVGDVAATDDKGRGILAIASDSFKEEPVKVLLEFPEVDVLQCDKEGRSALWWAVSNSNTNMIASLLENPQVKDSVRGGVNKKILHEAVELGTSTMGFDTVRYLLGFDVVVQNCCRLIDGGSPLHCAVRRNKKLLTPWARSVYCIQSGLTSWRMLKLLLNSGLFDVNAVDDDGMTALHHFCEFSTTQPLYPVLGDPWIPPEYAVAVMGNMLLSLCSSPDINIDAVDHRGETAMHKAVKAGNNVHVELLVEMAASTCVRAAEQLPLALPLRGGRVFEGYREF